MGILEVQNFKSNYSYLDIGCSNGYLTKLISQKFNFSISKGIDHNTLNLDIARNKYEDIIFEFTDLNIPSVDKLEKYNVITCFETIEHVGNIDNALQQILSHGKSGSSFILLSVPIEIGFWGIIKFIFKTLLGYSLKELNKGTTHLSYFTHLISNKSISKFRDNRDSWGTHYGFDYRKVDEILTKNKCEFKTENYLSTRFYLIKTK